MLETGAVSAASRNLTSSCRLIIASRARGGLAPRMALMRLRTSSLSVSNATTRRATQCRGCEQNCQNVSHGRTQERTDRFKLLTSTANNFVGRLNKRASRTKISPTESCAITSTGAADSLFGLTASLPAVGVG